ncbi:MAG: hypothetical protein HOV96_19540 [Nonomuraea sp.]|nr:hypothetical protein [Nonomuraea sp.]
MQCKAAPAVAFGFFADLGNAAAGLPWCWPCASEIVPVLLYQGFPINLISANKPAGLEHCQYGECPRLCHAGWRVCDTHREELREVYAGKSSGASVDPNPVLDGPEARYMGTVGSSVKVCFDCGSNVVIGTHNWPVCTNEGCPGKVEGPNAELFELPTTPTSTRGGYDR